MKQVSTSRVIDALGDVRAQIAALEVKEKALADTLKELGACHLIGKRYEATVYEGTKSTVDMEAIRAVLNAQYLADHTKHSIYLSVKVTALKPRS